MDEAGDEIAQGDLGLFQAFFRPDQLLDGGIDALIRGLGAGTGQEIDENIIDDVRNLLFGGTQTSPIDLGVFNMLRGYDHGIGTLNEVRVAYGLAPLTSFAELTSNTALATQLQQLYGSIDNLDLWIGGLVEIKVTGSQLGETFQTIVLDQFMRWRDGDAMFFEERMQDHPELLALIESTSLSDIILRNTDIDYFQDDAFIAHNRIGGTQWHDTLVGTESHDLMIGFSGNDKIYGKRGDDDLYGGRGRDKLFGGRGDDVMNGEEGNDKLYGGRGDDEMLGGDGRDMLFGGRGDDILDGGADRDELNGGRGDDMFVISNLDTADLIADYEIGELIDLRGLLDVFDTDGIAGLSQGDVYAAIDYSHGRLFVDDQTGSGFEKAATIKAAGFGMPVSVKVLVDDGAGNEASYVI